jgi:hypothetical protein
VEKGNMKSGMANKPTHIVKGNVFDALGFSASEASALKVKAEFCRPSFSRSEPKATHRLNWWISWTNISRR